MEPTPKRIDLGVSHGPNKSERAAISAANKKVSVHYGDDTPSEPVDVHEQARQSRANKTRTIQNEIDSTHSLPGGRNNPVHTRIPGADSADPQHQAMAKHSADFISAQVAGNRGRMESARAAFHTVRAASRGVPKGMEAPCSTPGCNRTTTMGSSCGEGGCSTGPNVKR